MHVRETTRAAQFATASQLRTSSTVYPTSDVVQAMSDMSHHHDENLATEPNLTISAASEATKIT